MNVGSRKYLLLWWPILLLAFAIGVHSLNLDPVWGDELSTLTNIGAFNPPFSPADVVESLQVLTPLDMPLYFVLAAFWAQVAGWSQFALRLLSLFAGVCLIAAVYRLGKDAFGARTGVVRWMVSVFAAPLIVASRFTDDCLAISIRASGGKSRYGSNCCAAGMSTSAFVIFYFHEIRMYSLLMLLVAIHIWFYFRTIQSKKVTLLSCLQSKKVTLVLSGAFHSSAYVYPEFILVLFAWPWNPSPAFCAKITKLAANPTGIGYWCSILPAIRADMGTRNPTSQRQRSRHVIPGSCDSLVKGVCQRYGSSVVAALIGDCWSCLRPVSVQSFTCLAAAFS